MRDRYDFVIVGGGSAGSALANRLSVLGIDTVVELFGVGENMQDHLEVYIQHSSKQPVSMQPYLALWRRPIIGFQWLFGKGPGASNQFEAGGFIRSNDEVDRPNVMFHSFPWQFGTTARFRQGGTGIRFMSGRCSPMRGGW